MISTNQLQHHFRGRNATGRSKSLSVCISPCVCPLCLLFCHSVSTPYWPKWSHSVQTHPLSSCPLHSTSLVGTPGNSSSGSCRWYTGWLLGTYSHCDLEVRITMRMFRFLITFSNHKGWSRCACLVLENISFSLFKYTRYGVNYNFPFSLHNHHGDLSNLTCLLLQDISKNICLIFCFLSQTNRNMAAKRRRRLPKKAWVTL